jgi:DNA gyrase subunit B
MSTYDSKDIQVLEGLEPVRRRPGMYIGSTTSTGLHHLIWEILDNSVDEALNGHCDTIEVDLHSDHSVTIKDNGRGVPVSMFKDTRKSAMEILFTTLHSGGKFDDDAYKVSGGLHGVGMAVVCALSEILTATSRRDGFEWTQSFSKGKPTTSLEKGKISRNYGTTVFFKPDPTIFPKIEFNPKQILERVSSKAFLNKGLKIVFKENGNTHTFQYPEGIKDYIRSLLDEKQVLAEEPFYIESESGAMRLETAFMWSTKTESVILSYANAIRTSDGGSHEIGFRNGITKALRAYVERRKLLPKGVNITGEDIKEGLTAIVSVYLQGDVEFQGQTKGRLNSDITSQVESTIKNSLEQTLHSHPALADTISNRIILSAQARLASRQAKDAVHRKTNISHRLNLPGKLSDCATVDRDSAELFICEGDSAGGSSKQARDRKTQAILPIRGKILNVETATLSKILANSEIKNIISAVGVGIEPKFEYEKLRYGKIIIMTDADVDGAHICSLLLTFFFRHMRKLIENGHLFIAQPPLYRIDSGKKMFYALDDAEKDRIVEKELKGADYEIGRFKGLGEMPAKDLKQTTMDKKSRSLIRVSINNLENTDKAFIDLMGKDALPRFNFITERALSVDNLDI